ncbi:MAG: hypothetical protein SFT94_04720 [Pseudanabaenaceae cyanobacterium bins.68]|nr:hypothetical protein [Pseudanabaenaceae cyanobacterium bins.68]
MKKLQFAGLAALALGMICSAGSALAQRPGETCIITNQNRVICGRPYNPGFDDDDRFPDRRNEIERTIRQIYFDVLGRGADREGLRTYTDRVWRDRWSYDRVRQELARSPEARAAINQLYVEILRRNADRLGLDTYLRELQNGRSLDWVRQQLASSPEANRPFPRP